MTILTEQERTEQARAIRALLRQPMLSRDHPAFGLVGEHQADLRRWFRTTTGWELVVETRRGLARLHKAPGEAALTRPLRSHRTDRPPFDRRRYELFCVTAAALGHFARRQVSLQDLSSRIISLTENDEELTTYVPGDGDERAALIDVLSRLCALEVIELLDEQGNYERQQDSNALYAIDEARLGALLPDEAPGVGRRQALMIRLLDDPVLYHGDLVELDQDCLKEHGRWFRKRCAEAGLLLERRAEGWCITDPSAETTDLRFPQLTAHVHQAALLMISRLAEAAGHDWLSASRIRSELDSVLAEHPGWAKKYRREDRSADLTAEVIQVLQAFDLVRVDELGLEFRPAAGRFSNVAIRRENP
ncbi:DUF2398 family protein [Amycolatopsis sp. A133]|uniref:DUF2398 family protein n=1 Tax=Amycolatopsis sp. A133 TaxID=3064472 RepID=UPI0027F8CE0F|nr:DUF2398 family protein [Amycolatopsis sp. A133]MDQ7802677.1 DUF2398 family protein [Amycolatopsis sp. A133]